MKTKMERRDFLQKATLLAAGFMASFGISYAEATNSVSASNAPILNPAFRINQIENGEIELFTYLKDKSKLSEIFAGLDADIILDIAHENHPLNSTGKFTKKYNITIPDCQLKIEQLMQDLQQSGIIYYGEKMLLVYNEIKKL